MSLIGVLSGIAFVCGLLILFYTLFSYEDEEKKVKSWFEVAWNALKNKDQGISVRLGSFLRKLLAGLNRVFARIYGERLISLRAVAVATCLVTAIVCFAGAFFFPENGVLYPHITIYTLPLASAFLLCIGASLFRRNWPSYIVAILILMYMIWESISVGTLYETIVMTGGALAFIFEALLIAVIRKFFMLAANSLTLRRTVGFILTSTLVVPMYLLVADGISELPRQHGIGFRHAALGFAMLNIVPVVTSLSFLVILLVAMALRVVYAVLPRAIYMPIKLKLLDNRKAATGLGIALMGVSIPGWVGFMEKAAKAMGLA